MDWLLKAIIQSKGKVLSWPFDQSENNPEKTQQSLLTKILRDNSDTEFGQKHRLISIRNVTDYRKNVPIYDYEGLEPFIDKSSKGFRNILTSEPPLRFNVTSCTTRGDLRLGDCWPDL